MKRDARIMPLMVAALAITGCQSPLLKGLGLSKSSAQSSAFSRADADGLLALEEGRVYLMQGQIAAAVASFRIAQLDPVAAPDAKNGLGVAYAKIGRNDLADRYFREALALRPGDDRFAANILRLQRDVMLARALPQEIEPVQTGQASLGPARKAELTDSLLQPSVRKAPPEYRIVTASTPAPAPVMRVGSRLVEAKKPEAASPEAAQSERLPLLSRGSVEPLEVAF